MADLAGSAACSPSPASPAGEFFATLRAAGAIVAATLSFPDHHPFTEADLRRVADAARRHNATPVTTPKDAVRLPAAWRERVRVVGVSLDWDDPPALDRLLAAAR